MTRTYLFLTATYFYLTNRFSRSLTNGQSGIGRLCIAVRQVATPVIDSRRAGVVPVTWNASRGYLTLIISEGLHGVTNSADAARSYLL